MEGRHPQRRYFRAENIDYDGDFREHISCWTIHGDVLYIYSPRIKPGFS